jgi:outer membrane protein
MKNNVHRTVKAVLLSTILLMMINVKSYAQEKTGYLNLNELVYSMPEIKTVKTELNLYQKQFVDQLTAMNTEFQTKGSIYEKQRATLTDAVKTMRETELAELRKRIADYNDSAQQQVTDRGNQLMKPIVDKVMAAITEVAKEKGYHMVIDDSASGNILGKSVLYASETDDLTAAVKVKLGIATAK